MTKSSKKSKTELLLEAIQPKEYMNFERYLSSKLGKCHLNYFDYWLWKKENMLEVQKGNAENVKPYKYTLTRKFLSDFNKLIEGYFTSVSIEHDEQLREILLLIEIRKRKVDKLTNYYLKKVKYFNKNRVLKGFDNNSISLKSYFEEYMFLNALNDEPGMVKITGNICEVSEIVYFQNELFNFINNKLFVGNAFKPTLNVDTVIKKIENDTAFFEKKHENVYVFYLISKLIQEFKTIDDLLKVVSYLRKKEKKFAVGFLNIVYEFLFRLAQKRIDISDKDALKTAYNAFKDIERKGTLKKLPQIQPLIFFSVVWISLRLEDIDFAEKFINNYSHKLNSVPHDDVLTVCVAMLDYEKGKLLAAEDLLIRLKVKNVILYLYSKTTLLKVLYDRNELRGIMSLSDTIKHFLQRKEKIRESYRQNIFKFLSYVTNLALAKRKNGRGLLQLRERLDLEKTFFEKKWVSDKLEELEKTFLK